MKYQIMIKMLMNLLSRKKMTAKEIADKYDISVRSVYRYIEELNVAGVPIDVVRGRYGGLYVADTFRLPAGYFTREEYTAAIDALTAMSSQVDDESVLSALEKLQSRQKADRRELSVCGNIIVDGGSWGDAGKFSEKMRVCEEAVNRCESLDIEYVSRKGERSSRIIDPYVMILKQNVWYVYAYCHKRCGFRTFKIGRIRKARFSGKTFIKKAISRDEIPLNFEYSSASLIPVVFRIRKGATAAVEEWLGVDNVEPRGNELIASVSLPDDETLVEKILSYGGKVTVESPADLKERVKKAAQLVVSSYD